MRRFSLAGSSFSFAVLLDPFLRYISSSFISASRVQRHLRARRQRMIQDHRLYSSMEQDAQSSSRVLCYCVVWIKSTFPV
ncbi:hypothetical protein JB92DRAFT_3077677, partial [Gautieria morchelliformis]